MTIAAGALLFVFYLSLIGAMLVDFDAAYREAQKSLGTGGSEEQ